MKIEIDFDNEIQITEKELKNELSKMQNVINSLSKFFDKNKRSFEVYECDIGLSYEELNNSIENFEFELGKIFYLYKLKKRCAK